MFSMVAGMNTSNKRKGHQTRALLETRGTTIGKSDEMLRAWPPGRPKGAGNKNPAAVREMVKLLVEKKLDKLSDWIDLVANGDPEKNIPADPKGAVQLLTGLLPYCTPALKAVAVQEVPQTTNLVGAMSPQAQLLANMNGSQITAFLKGEIIEDEGEVIENE